jgi:hypothetical protein
MSHILDGDVECLVIMNRQQAGGSSVIPINYQVGPFSQTTLDGTTVTVIHDFKVLSSEPVTLTIFTVPFSPAMQIH